MHRARSAVAVAAVAALLVIAGCSGGGGTATPPSTSDSTPEQTPTPSPTPASTPTPWDTATPTAAPTATPSPTATATATPSPLSTEAYWEQRLDAHERALRDASSFTAAQTLRVSGPAAALGPNEQNLTMVLVANGTERYQERRFEDRRIARYQSDAESPVYVRENRSRNVTYTKTSGQIGLSPFARPASSSFLSSFDYTDEGVVSTERGDRRKFSVDSVDAVGSTVADSYDGELVDVHYEVFVDPDREAITRIVYSVQLERAEGTVTLATALVVRDFGTADSDQPDWLGEARSQTE